MLRKAITFLCGYLSLRGVVSSLLLEINKYGICRLFTAKYNFGVVPEWGICTLFLNHQRQGLLCVIQSLTHPDFGCVKRLAEWFYVRLSFLFSPSPLPYLKSLIP